MDLSPYGELLGSIAGALTTLSFLPQVIRTWRSGSTRDISLIMFLAFCLGVALWILYGVIVGAWSIIIANIITLLLAGTILILKIRNIRRGKE